MGRAPPTSDEQRRRGRALSWIAVLALVVAAALLMPAPSRPASADADPPTIELIVFYGEGCPYCARELEFLEDLQQRVPQLRVEAYEIWNHDENRALFREMAAAAGVQSRYVPATFLGDSVWIGFDSAIEREIEASVLALAAGAPTPPPAGEATTIDVPLVGEVDVGRRSLIVASLLIGFVDGVNPCSFWVLSMLLALVLHSGSRRRVVMVGSLFLAVTAALYGLYIWGAYNVLDIAGELRWIRWSVAAVAAVLGVLHLKEYVTHSGLSLTIPDRRKPGMLARMRGLARADRSIAAAAGGTVVLAAGVSLVETPCTAGLPLLWTNLVSERGVPAAGVALLFTLYMLAFLIDELVVFAAAVTTLRATKLQERHGRALQLLSGLLMVALAAVMIVAPDLLESVAGTFALFGAVGLATVLVLGAGRVRLGTRHGQKRPAA